MSDHLHSVIISFNRLELTKRCLDSYYQTVSIPFSVVVVDNGSDAETTDWLQANVQGDRLLLLGENKFPGYATNRGWERMPPQTTFLHRSDNDFEYLPDWCEAFLMRFYNKPDVGQVGLRTPKEEMYAPSNVGGNNVIRRELWDKGLRYDERPWGEEYPPGWTEDSLFTPAVVKMGYMWKRVSRPCIRSTSVEDPSDPYYQKTWELRGILSVE